jgi:hypothetical protein
MIDLYNDYGGYHNTPKKVTGRGNLRAVLSRLPVHRGMTPLGLDDPDRHAPNCRYVAFMKRLGFSR